MNKPTLCIFLLSALFGVATAQERQLDGDNLQQILNPAERKHYVHSKELKSDEMHLLLKQRPPKANKKSTEGASADVNKTANPHKKRGAKDENFTNPKGFIEDPVGSGTIEDKESEKQSFRSPLSKLNKPKVYKRATTDRYIPPSWKSGQNRSAALGSFKSDRKKKSRGPYFGIRLGEKIRAYLPQVTTNVEQNLTEIWIKQDVFGDYKTMPKDTKLYCKKTLNPGSNRLELLAVKGITPQGEEFKLKGIILDINSVAGLVGAISTDGNTGKRSIASGVFGVGEALAPILNDGSIVGAGVEAAAENALKEKAVETAKSLNKATYTIYVNPQKIQIRVEETF